MGWRDDPEFNRVLDAIYASFMKRKAAVAGRPDREVRDPAIVLGLVERLGLGPDPARTIRVTGSKGKGTTARMIARLLTEETGGTVGLMVSPEEADHNDRIRINGKAISKLEFIALHESLSADLDALDRSLEGDRYVSPFGTFLVLALAKFHEAKVDYLVLEGGRGARYDEVGGLASKVAVLTSIFDEHPDYLGPEPERIAEDKLTIGVGSERLVLDAGSTRWNDRLGVVPSERLEVVPDPEPAVELPFWLERDKALARAAVAAFLGRPVSTSVDLDDCSAAFGRFPFGEATAYYDACISAASLDLDLLERLAARPGGLAVLASFPDDKDVEGLRAALRDLPAAYGEVALSGTRGYLHYAQTLAGPHCLGTIHYDSTAALTGLARDLLPRSGAETLYCPGTQTFIRLVK